jgi:CHAT domain-containing protein/tetratricopeptide (TPR) repeat protein
MEAEKIFAQPSDNSLKLAVQKYDEAIRLWRAIGEHQREASVLVDLGVTYLSAAEPQEALRLFNRALLLTRSERDREGEAFVVGRIGVAYYRMEKVERSQVYAKRAQQLWNALGQRFQEASQLQNLGDGYYDLANYQSALETYFSTLPLYQDYGGQRDVAIILNNIGATYRALDMDEQSLEYFGQALPLLQHPANCDARATALYNMGTIYIKKGEEGKALEYLTQALPLAQSMADRKRVGEILNVIGYAYFKLDDYSKATASYEQSIKVWQEIHNRRGESQVLHDIGGMYFTRGETQKAHTYYQQALTLAHLAEDKDGEGRILDSIGNLYLREGKIQQALDSYLKSLDLGERIRSASSVKEFKRNFEDQLADTYQSAVLLHMQLGQFRQAFDVSERARSRTFLDQLGNGRPDVYKGADDQLLQRERALASELNSLEQLREQIGAEQSGQDGATLHAIDADISAKQRAYSALLTRLKLSNPEYLTLRNVSTLPLPSIQRLLDRETTLLSYFVTPQKTLAFVITKSDFRAVEIQIREEDLRAKVAGFRRFDNTSETHPESLSDFGNLLVAPVRPYLKTSVIGVIPNGILHYLPFTALIQDGRYLGNSYTLFTLPSASVLPHILRKRKSAANNLLALSQSRTAGLPVLEHADQEVKSIARLFAAAPLTTRQATKSSLFSRAGRYSLLHIAAHAELNPLRPLFSRIYLAPGKTDNGSVYVYEIYGLNLRKANLVVLSACDTSLGVQSRGDDIVGLNRAFIYAGTPTVIASLWRVDDESTSMLMKSFYTHLKEGLGKAAALQAAQNEISKSYPNPYYWAAFVLTGDPGK